MAPRKRGRSRRGEAGNDAPLFLLADVRRTPIEVYDAGRSFSPVAAFVVRGNDGQVLAAEIDEPDHPAETLARAIVGALQDPNTDFRFGPPRLQIAMFDEQLAREVQELLSTLEPEIAVIPRAEPFEALVDHLLAQIAQVNKAYTTLDFPDNVRRSLISAVRHVWQAAPWSYLGDEPPIGLVPREPQARPLYACVLGAEDLPGVALYTSRADYDDMLVLGSYGVVAPESTAGGQSVLTMLRQLAFIVTFEPSEGAAPSYREELARHGWSRRLEVVPALASVDPQQGLRPLTADEAAEVARALDALVAGCHRHREALDNLDLPIRDSVEVNTAGTTEVVDVAIPADEDPAAPPPSVYRLKVSLLRHDVWRRIDIRSDETLVDLHYAIQEAFDWDDDHLYAFYMSGKAWDTSTEFVRPEAQQPGERSARVRLDRLNLRAKKRFLYIFDFGDEWRHDIQVETTKLEPEEDATYPRIVEEHGTPPPQYPVWDEGDEDVLEEDEDWDDGESDGRA